MDAEEILKRLKWLSDIINDATHNMDILIRVTENQYYEIQHLKLLLKRAREGAIN